MSAILSIDNFPSINIKERTSFNADAAVGAASFTAVSTQNIATGDFLYVGQLGSEVCEKVTATVSGLTVSVSPVLTFAHKRFEDVTNVKGDQIRIYRSANVTGLPPDDSTFTVLATVSIDPDSLATSYEDTGGGTGYWYKATYRNSTSGAETALGYSLPVRGGGYGHYVTLDAVRTEAGLQSASNISDGLVDSARVSAEGEVNGELNAVYTTPFADPVPEPVATVVLLIAAGHLLKKQYGVFATGTNKDGQDKLDEGRALLTRIKNREITLYDSAGNSLLLQQVVSSWPNSTTATATETDDGGDVINKISHTF